jgi:hypothetical protein
MTPVQYDGASLERLLRKWPKTARCERNEREKMYSVSDIINMTVSCHSKIQNKSQQQASERALKQFFIHTQVVKNKN